MKNRNQFFILLLFIPVISIILFSSCSGGGVVKTSTSVKQSVINMTAAETKALIQANSNNPDFIIIDVRTPEEFASGHLEKAILINYNSASFKDEISKLDRTKKYLVYCRTGNRSSGARDMMKDLGFIDINHMDGGITEWTAKGYPVVK